MTLRRVVWCLVASLLLCPTNAFAKGGGRSSSSRSSKSSSDGPVQVRSYTRKDGTHVNGYTRGAPHKRAAKSGSGGPASDSAGVISPSVSPVAVMSATRAVHPLGPGAAAGTVSPLVSKAYSTPLNPDQAAEKRFHATLANARNLIRAGVYAAAETLLQRIINGAPGTRIAHKAQAELANLPKH